MQAQKELLQRLFQGFTAQGFNVYLATPLDTNVSIQSVLANFDYNTNSYPVDITYSTTEIAPPAVVPNNRDPNILYTFGQNVGTDNTTVACSFLVGYTPPWTVSNSSSTELRYTHFIIVNNNGKIIAFDVLPKNNDGSDRVVIVPANGSSTLKFKIEIGFRNASPL